MTSANARRLVAAAALVAPALTGCSRESPPPQVPVVPQPGPAPKHTPTGPFGYRLPVLGAWRVHRTHYGARNDQAYAVDLVAAGPRLRQGDGRRNADYASYDQPVVADAPGVVAVAVDGVPENAPGEVNRYAMHGNYVVIDHQNGEFSLFAHLIPGSVRVRPGQWVEAGTELGRCGNSGHSTMPHLHWQVMDHWNPNGARGLPPRLAPYQRNGVPSTELLQKGDTIMAP
jgi:murein DD-endopeptidase MepM/ murein hydrolase activator NlpD